MSMGAERAEALPQGDTEYEGEQAFALPEAESPVVEPSERDESVPGGRRALAVSLALLAIGWLVVAGLAVGQSWPVPSLAAWTGWVTTISVPLILLASAWLLFGRSSRRETERFTLAVQEMRRESQALESVLGIVAGRLQENRAALSEEAARLMSLGDEASDRLGRVTHYLARETAELDRKAQALDNAAATARVDIGALMSDLPQAEAQARAAADALRTAGLSAHEQAAALEAHLAALSARGRDADETLGGAAQRLGAQIARIESSTGAAAERIDQAAVQMNAAVDGAMTRASDSVDHARAGIEEQGRTMLAMVEQSRAAFEHAGAEATRRLSERLEQVGAHLETLAGQLAAQEAATQALVTGLSSRLAEIDGQIAMLGEHGDTHNARLSQSMEALKGVAQALHAEVAKGESASGDLIDRAHQMAATLTEITAQLREQLPSALADVEARAGQTGAAALAAVPSVEAIQAAAAMAAESLSESEKSVVRQRASLDALLEQVREGTAQAEDRLRALGATVEATDGSAARLAQETGPQLIESLVRVREAAQQAAVHAREAIAAAIPESAAKLAEASRKAVVGAVTEPVEDQLAELAAASQRAMAVARQASERLTRQLLVMSETAVAIEDRIAEDQALREENAAENLTRRVSLLIEALNSTAIDVSKILSNEVADSAWAAYLKGDRGVFTRRAVRLLDSGEAREIQRHYEEETDFREQVNRYVHDFEAMLRRVLAERDGATLGVTLLSSDMGKLYVALAQAIDRLRR
ncbi:hypothetical protein [Sphingosinicella sp. CPCC 101087]|uniref:hypothetical protein n=1 Tax=Sphingosinicella sp. CPCC 101087 TaxID=2497754 RepID=UPI00101CFAFC|nr:hypothetical protein [Sphingosinicella sp. CPCC 101087]